jgi:hypothetical protein
VASRDRRLTTIELLSLRCSSTRLVVTTPADERSQVQKDRREALLKEYSEISSNFRALTDIRFRLLQLSAISAFETVRGFHLGRISGSS